MKFNLIYRDYKNEYNQKDFDILQPSFVYVVNSIGEDGFYLLLTNMEINSKMAEILANNIYFRDNGAWASDFCRKYNKEYEIEIQGIEYNDNYYIIGDDIYKTL